MKPSCGHHAGLRNYGGLSSVGPSPVVGIWWHCVGFLEILTDTIKTQSCDNHLITAYILGGFWGRRIPVRELIGMQLEEAGSG